MSQLSIFGHGSGYKRLSILPVWKSYKRCVLTLRAKYEFAFRYVPFPFNDRSKVRMFLQKRYEIFTMEAYIFYVCVSLSST